MNGHDSQAARIFAALADPVRLSILRHLADGELRVTDLRERVGGSQANVSEHLSRLRVARLVLSRPAGRQTFYRVADARVMRLIEECRGLLGQVGTEPESLRPVTSTPIIDALRAGRWASRARRDVDPVQRGQR